MTAHGVDRVAADKAQTYCPRLEGSPLGFLGKASCPDTYELLNNLRFHVSVSKAHVPNKRKIHHRFRFQRLVYQSPLYRTVYGEPYLVHFHDPCWTQG